jgi:hypothetical protein
MITIKTKTWLADARACKIVRAINPPATAIKPK